MPLFVFIGSELPDVLWYWRWDPPVSMNPTSQFPKIPANVVSMLDVLPTVPWTKDGGGEATVPEDPIAEYNRKVPEGWDVTELRM